MRHPIERSPRDGTAIILEDDASGTYDVAHWSAEAGEWVGENGEPTKITPTHWHPIPRDQYLLRDDARSRNTMRRQAWISNVRATSASGGARSLRSVAASSGENCPMKA